MSNDYLYFKFRAINKHLVESLVRPSLYFSKPAALNDPFDCQLDVRKAFERAADSAERERKHALLAALESGHVLNSFEKHFADIGVCSFSLGGLDDPLLWAHYGDEHKGVCLLYRFPESFLLDPQQEIIGVDKVKYGSDVLTNWLTDSSLRPADGLDFMVQLTQLYLTAKHDAWGYEKEARIIRSAHGVLDIPRGYLEQVCFGLRTPQADIDLITTLASEHSGCQRFCRIVRAGSDFGIVAQEM